jgi:RNA polymerase sigma-70 factor (ECF subfamily)
MTRPILLPVPNAPSDAELVARALEGDRFGVELIYRRQAAYLLAMTTRLLASRGEAEETVRETFVVGLRHLSRLRTPEALREWLARIAVGLARRRLRRARLLRLLGLDRRIEDATLAALAAPDARLDDQADLARVDRVLGDARPAARVAWMLHRVEGLGLDEVAAACDCSRAAVLRRVAEIDARLRGRPTPPGPPS